MTPNVNLTRQPLQMIRADALAYGAKDTGEMGGGAAAAILRAAGPELGIALKAQLPTGQPRVGDVLVTEAFGLGSGGVRWILHVISIIKHTPSGAFCPQPERIRRGVSRALETGASLGASSMAMSALATGEGRVDPRTAACSMLGGVQDFRGNREHSELVVWFSLPTFQDYEAFQSVLAGCG